jgi:cytochrome c-type biogenesis protein CcmF
MKHPARLVALVVAVVVVLLGVVLAASSAYGANRDVKLRRGQSATVSGYTLTYLGSHTARSDQKVTVSADIRVERGDRVLGTYAPAISTYPNSTEGIGTPSVHTGITDDVYLTLISARDSRNRITLGVRINPMIVWLWIGGGCMALGTILALAPRLKRRPRAEPPAGGTSEPEPHPDDRSEPEDEPLEEISA